MKCSSTLEYDGTTLSIKAGVDATKRAWTRGASFSLSSEGCAATVKIPSDSALIFGIGEQGFTHYKDKVPDEAHCSLRFMTKHGYHSTKYNEQVLENYIRFVRAVHIDNPDDVLPPGLEPFRNDDGVLVMFRAGDVVRLRYEAAPKNVLSLAVGDGDFVAIARPTSLAGKACVFYIIPGANPAVEVQVSPVGGIAPAEVETSKQAASDNLAKRPAAAVKVVGTPGARKAAVTAVRKKPAALKRV